MERTQDITLWTRRKWKYRAQGALLTVIIIGLALVLFGCQGFGAQHEATITQDGADATATRHTVTTPASTTVVEKIDPASGAVVERKTTTTEPSYTDTVNMAAHSPSVQATGTEAANGALTNRKAPEANLPPLPGEKPAPAGSGGGAKGGTGTSSASALDWFNGDSPTGPLIWIGALLIVVGVVGYFYLRSSPLAVTSPVLKPLALGLMAGGGILIAIGSMLDKVSGLGWIVLGVFAVLIAAGIYLIRTHTRSAAAAGEVKAQAAATAGTLESAIDAIAAQGSAALRRWLDDLHTRAPAAEYQQAMDYAGKNHAKVLTGA